MPSKVWKAVKSNLPDAVTPQIVFFGLGVIIGAARKAATAGKITEEVRQNPHLIQDALKKLQDSLQIAPAVKQQAAAN